MFDFAHVAPPGLFVTSAGIIVNLLVLESASSALVVARELASLPSSLLAAAHAVVATRRRYVFRRDRRRRRRSHCNDISDDEALDAQLHALAFMLLVALQLLARLDDQRSLAPSVRRRRRCGVAEIM